MMTPIFTLLLLCVGIYAYRHHDDFHKCSKQELNVHKFSTVSQERKDNPCISRSISEFFRNLPPEVSEDIENVCFNIFISLI